MATIAFPEPHIQQGDHFFERVAFAMALVVIAGFSMQFAMGRSTFAARPLVHLHGVAFMGWVALFVVQARLATVGPIALHRRLGWVATGWAALLVVLGCWLTGDVIMRGTTPFFFQPQHFLIANPLTVICFAALTYAAVRLRRQTDWHRRLHICGMTAIMGPAFGRLLPMPFLIPYAFDLAILSGLIFPVIGMVRDYRKTGRVHQAWWWGFFAVLAVIPLAHVLAQSWVGNALYTAITNGHPGAAVPGLEFAAPPPASLVTGR